MSPFHEPFPISLRQEGASLARSTPHLVHTLLFITGNYNILNDFAFLFVCFDHVTQHVRS